VVSSGRYNLGVSSGKELGWMPKPM